MKWLKDRTAALTMAKGHKAWLLSAAASLFFMGLSQLWPQLQALFSKWIVVLPPEAGGGMIIFGLPAWHLFFDLALFCVIGWLFESLVKAHKDLTPKFAPSFNQDDGGISETILIRQKTGEFVDDCKYLRLTVQNLSQRSIESCVANLVKIEQRLSPTANEVVWDQDSLPLTWSMIGGFEVKVHSLAKRFVDVGRILKKSGIFKLATIVPNRLATKLSEHGVFILTVVVTGDGISKSEQIEVAIDGTFDGFTARPVTAAAIALGEGSGLQSPLSSE